MSQELIQAWQHIYTNVEKEQSPRQRGGFQTLFYTQPGLTEREVEEMEGRLLYFPSTVEPVKRLFFTTGSGKGVVAQVVPLPDPDQLGRKGRYLAHALVFAPEVLPRFQADPFQVFRHFTFVRTVEEALAVGDFQTGTIPAVSLALPADPAGEVETTRTWSGAELKKLALLALRAGQQADRRDIVTIAGEPEQISQALAAAFTMVPALLRPRCSFDTYFYRCNPVATYFWAVGLPEPPVSARFALVEAAARQVQATLSLQPETSYERWVVTAIDAGRLEDIFEYRDEALALGEWLDGREYDLSLLEAAPPQLISAVLKINPEAVRTGLRNQVGRHLSPPLAGRVMAYLLRDADEMALYRYLRQEFELSQLVEMLHESYAAEEFQKPAKEEIKAMEELLAGTSHPVLELFLVFWRSGPGRQLAQALAQAEEDGYRQFGQVALKLKLVEPFKLLVHGRGDAFLDLYPITQPAEVVEVAGALIKAKEIECLNRLTDQAVLLPARKLRQLARLTGKTEGVPEPFKQAVEQAMTRLPANKGIAGIWRSIWPFRDRG